MFTEFRGFNNLNVAVVIMGSIGVITSIFSITSVYCKCKKLNFLIKSLLQCSLVHHFLANFLTVFASSLIINEGQNTNICIALRYISVVIWPVHFICNSLISVFRFYIFWKTEHHRIVNKNKLMILASGCLMAHYICKSLMTYFSLGSKVELVTRFSPIKDYQHFTG